MFLYDLVHLSLKLLLDMTNVLLLALLLFPLVIKITFEQFLSELGLIQEHVVFEKVEMSLLEFYKLILVTLLWALWFNFSLLSLKDKFGYLLHHFFVVFLLG